MSKKGEKHTKLSRKHENFCQEFVSTNNKADSYMATYKSCRSRKTAYNEAGKLLKKHEIKTRIAELDREKVARQEKTADDLIRHLWHIATDDIKNYLSFKSVERHDPATDSTYHNIDIEIKDSDKIDTSNIAEISKTREGSFKFKLKSSDNALRLLKEIYFDKKHEVGEQENTITFGGDDDVKNLIEEQNKGE